MKKNSIFRFRTSAAIVAAFLLLGGNLSRLNGQAGSDAGGLTRSMEQAIRLYHEGNDNDAMDRFMDILVRGTPSEKSLANDYISKITLRMNTGVKTVKDPGLDVGTIKEAGGSIQAPVQTQQSARLDQTPSEEEALAQDEPQARKERVTSRINEKMIEMRRTILLELDKSSAVKIYMGDSMPKAITINSQYFFTNETVFKANAAADLSNLAGLIFTLGKANILILPEGTVEADVKIRSIRQAIALNSYLVSRGISQSRIDLNLTGADVKFPKELTSVSGMVILFNYDRVPKLMESSDAQSKGPKVSLGIYPTAISVQKNEGALVEFSVFESPVGKPSWKFEIFSVQPDNSIISLQKMEGYGPQYNQSYWNGRKNFFGTAYPSGKYLFSVTATDPEGRETNLRRLLIVKPSPEEQKALQTERPAAKSAAASKQAGASGQAKVVKGKKLPLNKGKAAFKGGASGLKAGVKGKGKLAPLTKKKPAAARVPKKVSTASAEESAPKDETVSLEGGAQESQTEFSGQVSYKIYFREETAIVTANSEKKLAQVAETMGYYPMAKIKLIGYAYSGEANSETMAQNRVNYVSMRLSSKYKIEKDRMDISTQISDAPKSIVEIKMLGKE